MYELAKAGDDFISLSQISDAQKVSQGYLEQIVRPLRESRLVTGKRGFGGGYKLTRPAGQITVGEIIKAAEGPTVPVECVSEDFSHCNCPDDCRAKLVWQKVGEAIDGVLDSITLLHLIEDAEYNRHEKKGEISHE